MKPPGGVELLDLEPGDCRFALTRELPHRFCAARQVKNSAYCREHARICSARASAQINVSRAFAGDRRKISA